MKRLPSLTRERLRELLHYDPETGRFTWNFGRPKCRSGGRAGNLDSSNGYRRICIDGQFHYEHRLAFFYMTGSWPQNEVDHANRDRSDNRWGNLREATDAQNQGNTGLRRDNKSGVRGVAWNKISGKWRAEIRRGGRSTSLGLYESKEAAAAAYAKAAEAHFGNFSQSPRGEQ